MSHQEICESKRRYRKRADAERVATRFNKRFRVAYRLKTYQCPVCDEWHLTKGVGR